MKDERKGGHRVTTKTTHQSDLDIAMDAKMEPIEKIAAMIGVEDEALEPYGHYKAKIDPTSLKQKTADGKVVLVTAISPTPAGEGKSTVTVGLADAFTVLGHRAMVAMREPSLGPVMGLKGGAAGGGYSQVLPMEEINLHFTGDIHAITAANNALSAFIDNHIHRGNALNIDPRRITWNRVLDMNDRALRNVIVGLGGEKQGVPREDHFDITVASEVMAVFCLATDLSDLKVRLGEMMIGYTYDDEPVYVKDLQVEGALALLLKEALKPNLVQTIGGTPALVHGGPFANIAHGCNSVIATDTARKLSDIVITEAGFGSDLGAEKFMNIKARAAEFEPDAVVIVATVRALKMHGGVEKDHLQQQNVEAVMKGIVNLEKHIETIRTFGIEPVVALNHFVTDTEEEIDAVLQWCEERNVRAALTKVWEQGGKGGVELAEQVLELFEEEKDFELLYDLEASVEQKVEEIVRRIYGGSGVHFTDQAKKDLAKVVENGWDELPVCMAKTQYSLSDDPKKLGRPEDFQITIRSIVPKVGAGFLVCLTGDIMTMPGLPERPAALQMDVDEEGRAKGLM